MSNDNIIHTLWIGDHLSAMENLTLQSFLNNGFTVYLWTYGNNLLIPNDIIRKDANEIIPASSIFSYETSNKYGHGKGSLSGFSDIFRYKLLYERGGIWVDTDVTCLKKPAFEEPYFFRYHHQIGLVGNVLKAPQYSPLMEWCYKKAIEVVNKENTNWLLPIEILKEGVYLFKLEYYIKDISNQDSFPVVREMYLYNNAAIKNWSVIHWMNEEFRRMHLDKDIAVKGSLYQHLLDKYGVDYRLATDKETAKIKWETSKIKYSLLNLVARYKWYKKKLFNNL